MQEPMQHGTRKRKNSHSGKVMPITTEDQMTIVEHAMAFDSNENATVRPASESLTRNDFFSLLFEGRPSAVDGVSTAVRGAPLSLCHPVAKP